MGDELPNPLDDATLPAAHVPLGETNGSTDLTEVGQVVNDCASLVASLEDTILNDISNCANECHGDTGLCQSCVLGDIASYINNAGMAMASCADKVSAQVNQSVGEAWAAAFGLGVPPPTQLQLDQAANGQVIDFSAPPDQGQGANNGAGLGITPTPIPNPNPNPIGPPPGIQCPTGINPAAITYLTVIPGAGYCIPGQWDTSAINNWCVVAFGGDASARVELYPTASTPGVYSWGGCQFAIPQVCPAEISPPTTPPPAPTPSPAPGNGGTSGNGNATDGTGGSGSTVPGGGGNDTLTGGGGNGTGIPGEPPPSSSDCPASFLHSTDQCVTMEMLLNPRKYLERLIGSNADNFGPVIYWDIIPDTQNPGRLRAPRLDGEPDCYFETAVACFDQTTPPPAPAPTPKEKLPPGILACDPDNLAAAVQNIIGPTISSQQSPADQFYSFFGVKQSDCPTTAIGLITSPLTALACFGANIVKSVGESFTSFISTPDQQTSATACSDASYTFYATANGVIQLLNKFTSLLPLSVVYSAQGKLNYCQQYLIPTTQQATAAYSRGYFTTEQAEFVWRWNGDCVPWQRKLTEANKTRIGIQDAYRLFILGKISEPQLREAWTRQGIDFVGEGGKWVDAIQQYPGMADLIRMMVRDVQNLETVEALKLDGVGASAFENNWTDTLKTWGNAQGVSDEVARYFYRAHWQNPSISFIYDALHRLRPDDRAENDPNAALVFDKDAAAKALAIADYVPGLVDAYLALSYKPFSRVDIRRMWTVGTFTTEDQVRRAYRDLGYDASHAEQLARFTIDVSATARAKLSGELTVSEVSQAYRKDYITESEAANYLQRAGVPDDAVANTITSIDNRKVFDSRKIALDSLQKRYNRGEFTDAEARLQLTNAYADPADADRIVRNWSFQRNAREKSPTIAMLCKWYGKGQITLDNFLVRVRNLNYNESDALNIVTACQTDVSAKRQADLERALAKVQKEEQAKAREAARLLRESKAQARALKLQHKIQTLHKQVTKNGAITITDTYKTVDSPDVNITATTEQTDTHTEQP